MNKLSILVVLAACLLTPVLASAQDGGALTFDQPVTGEITDDTPETRYTFEGAAGETITINMNAPQPGLDSYLELLAPNGDSLLTADDFAGTLNSQIGPYSLPESGVYTVIATRCCGGQGASTGPYELVLKRAQVTPLAIGETARADLNDNQPSAYYTVQGDSAAQPILSLLGETIEGNTNFLVEVRNPSGQVINSGWQSNNAPVLIDPLVFSEDGNYLISVSRQQNNDPAAEPVSGNVRFSLTLQEIQTQPIEIGGTVNGMLDDSNPSDHYIFSGTPTDLLRLTGSQTPDGEAFEVTVIAPDGFGINGANTAYLEPQGSFTLDPLQLFVPGEHLLVVRRLDMDGDGEMGASNYTLTLGASESPTLQAGTAVQDTVGGDTFERVYRYEGTAGQTIRITLRSQNDSYAPGLSVQGPNILEVAAEGAMGSSFVFNVNSSVPATAIYEVTLPQEGTYLFRVSNGAFSPAGPAVGDFSLLVEVIG